jgi:hypothetical protein
VAVPGDTTARASAPEHLVQLDLGVMWERNWASPRLIDSGNAWLIVEPYHDDDDRRWVSLCFRHSDGAVVGPPNDEARSGHRLWEVGLRECSWAGEVLNSEWVRRLERQNAVHPRHDPSRWKDLRHYVLLFKEVTAEVLCKEVKVERINAVEARRLVDELFGYDTPEEAALAAFVSVVGSRVLRVSERSENHARVIVSDGIAELATVQCLRGGDRWYPV